MRKIYIFLVTLLLAASLSATVFAAGAYVTDDASILSSYEVSQLNKRADEISGKYDITVRILTVASLNGISAQRYADAFYDNNLLTQNNGNGILLLVALTDREWAVTTNGDTVSVITNTDIDSIMENVQPELSMGNYYEAFDQFLTGVEKEYRAKDMEPWIRVFVSLLIGAVAGGIILLVMQSGMKTAKRQHGAGSYMVESSYDLFQCRDIFLYSRTTKIRKPENNSSGGRSGGGSRGGRSGHF